VSVLIKPLTCVAACALGKLVKEINSTEKITKIASVKGDLNFIRVTLSKKLSSAF
jgi:hypothetical protein